jgi:cytokine receptor domeless
VDDQYRGSNLFFYNNDVKVDDRYVSVLNETAIELKIERAQEMNTKFICKLNGTDGVDYTDVKVGYRPGPIKELKCISNNWLDLNCTFQAMHNPVPVTNYKLKFRSYKYHGHTNECKLEPRYIDFQYECYMNNSSKYQQFRDKYYFTLETTNQFGNYSQEFVINHYENIVLAPPINLMTSNITSNSVLLEWGKQHHLNAYSSGIVFDMVVKSECDSSEWKRIDIDPVEIQEISNSTNTVHKMWLTLLEYAHTWYDIRLRMQTKDTNRVHKNDEEFWSKWTNVTFQTKQRRPDDPPEIDVGGFNINDNGDLYIYWREWSKCEQNGGNFTYVVESNDISNKLPNEQSNLMAIYRKERINLMIENLVKIWSRNDMGLSERYSSLRVPGVKKRLAEPRNLQKFLVNGEYQITWSPPLHTREKIVSYTVFWCDSKSELPNNCLNSINFEHLPPNVTFFSMRSPMTLNFAIAANSGASTSGMVWAACTAAQSTDIGKIKTFWRSSLGSTDVKLEWKVECADLSIAKGYIIEYCPFVDPKMPDCQFPEKKENITGTSSYTLTGLRSYTLYKINIRMYSNSTIGPPSDPMEFTTLEGVPTEPRNLIARNVQDTSVKLFWEPELHTNGVFNQYDIYVYDDKRFLEKHEQYPNNKVDNETNRVSYTLHGLKPFSNYTILVSACTQKCSNASNKVEIETKIGVPSEMSSPKVSGNNSDILLWDPPTEPNGHLDFYELNITFRESGRLIRNMTVLTRQRACQINNICMNSTGVYSFSVRAANFVPSPHFIGNFTHLKKEATSAVRKCEEQDQELLEWLKLDPFGQILKSKKSIDNTHRCLRPNETSDFLMLFALLVVAALVILIIVTYFYRKIKDMKDIIVQMPPGLEDLTTDTKIKPGLDLIKRPDLIPIHNPIDSNVEDECLLKRSLNGSLNGDYYANSSGKSSSSESDSHSTTRNDEISDDVDYERLKHKQLISDEEDDEHDHSISRPMVSYFPTKFSKFNLGCRMIFESIKNGAFLCINVPEIIEFLV